MSRTKIIRPFMLYWMPFFLYCSIIVYLSHESDPTFGAGIAFNDTLAHAIEYFILFLITIRAFQHGSFSYLRRHAFIASFIFSIMFACTDEWHQYFIPGRQSSILDICADITGIALGAYIFRMRMKYVE